MTNANLIQDLDAILASRAQTQGEEDCPGSTGNSPTTGSNGGIIVNLAGWPRLKIIGTSVIIVPVVIDDSYSITDKNIRGKLKEGAHDMAEELKTSAERHGKEVLLALTGFKDSYFRGNIQKMDIDGVLDRISFNLNYTPLVSTANDLARVTSKAEAALNQIGINVTVSMLLITDGEPIDDEAYPKDFRESWVNRKPHWSFSAMGITRSAESDARRDRRNFTEIFQSMGIDNIVTPSSSGVRDALCAFSKSVSMV